MNLQRQLWIMSGLSVVVIIAAMLLPPIPQSVDYHHFADQRDFFGIPNFSDVISNLGFLLSGGAGLMFLWRVQRMPAQTTFHHDKEGLPYWVLFFSVTMVAFGSIYYHWAPDIHRLLWDRIPIAVAIAALLSATLTERVSPTMGLRMLPLLVILAVLSVLYWYWTERQGSGNLNFYIGMQFYLILLIVWVSLRFPSRYSHSGDIYQVVGLYAFAKVAELLDRSIFTWVDGWVSGHTLKHMIAAYAAYRIVLMLQKRVLLD